MFNSNEMCLPLCAPFVCCEVDTRHTSFFQEPSASYYAELFLLREGRLRVSQDQDKYLVSCGDVVLFCPGVVHSLKREGDEPVRMDLIRMDPDRMPEMPAYAPSLKEILSDAARSRVPMHVSAAEARKMALPEMTAGASGRRRK